MLGSSLSMFGSGALPSLNAANQTGADLAEIQPNSPSPWSRIAGCHSGSTPAAGLDLQRFTTMESVIDDFAHWTLVSSSRRRDAATADESAAGSPAPAGDRLDYGVAEERKRKRAGDPGPASARRLSNAEYNYTVRDLTGVDLRPAREFPTPPTRPASITRASRSPSRLR